MASRPYKPRRATFSVIETASTSNPLGIISPLPEETSQDDGAIATSPIQTAPTTIVTSDMRPRGGTTASAFPRKLHAGPPGFTPAAVLHPVPSYPGGSASTPNSPLSSTFNHLLLKPVERSSLSPYAAPPSPSRLSGYTTSDWDPMSPVTSFSGSALASPIADRPFNGIPMIPRSPISPSADAMMQSTSGIEGLIRPSKIVTSVSTSAMASTQMTSPVGTFAGLQMSNSVQYQASVSPAPMLSSMSLTSPSSPQPCRTVYLGNLPTHTPPHLVLDRVRCGAIEAYRTLPEKNCAFVAFLSPNDAATFHREATQLSAQHRFLVDGQEVRVSWGKPSPVPTQVQREVNEHNASRNVFFGDLIPGVDTEDRIRTACEAYGQIDQIRVLPEKRIAFVHMCAIADAIKIVRELSHEREWQGRRINYGKDRCAPTATTPNTAIPMATSPLAGTPISAIRNDSTGSPFPTLAPSLVASLSASAGSPGPAGLSVRSAPASRKPSEAMLPTELVMPQPKAPVVAPAPIASPDPEKEAMVQRFASMAIKAGIPNEQAVAMARQAVEGSEPQSPAAPVAPAGPAAPIPVRAEEVTRQHAATISGYPDGDMHAAMSSSMSMGSVGAMDGPLSQRTVYLGNLHPETTLEELCNVIRGGGLENIKIMADRGIAFVTFLEEVNAAQFLMRVQRDGMTVRHRKLKIGWGRPVPVLSADVREAVQFHGASRNVYIGGLSDPDSAEGRQDGWTVERVRRDFEEYGEIEMINRPSGMDCAFVNFTKIQSAIRAVEDMKNKPKPAYSGLRVNYGKDRCANAPRNNSTASMSARAMTPAGMSASMSMDTWMIRAGTADPAYGRTAYSSSVVSQFRALESELHNATPSPAPMTTSASLSSSTHPIGSVSLGPRPLRQGQSVGSALAAQSNSSSSWRSGSRYMQLRRDSNTGPPPGVPAPSNGTNF